VRTTHRSIYWFEHVEGTTFKPHPADAEYRFSRSAAGDLIEGGWPEIVICSGEGIGPLAMYEHNQGQWTKHVLIERQVHIGRRHAWVENPPYTRGHRQPIVRWAGCQD